MNELTTRTGVAKRSQIGANQKPLNEVMVDLLNAGRDPALEEELCLQLDLFCCTLHAATTATLSFTVPAMHTAVEHIGGQRMWRPTQREFLVELELALQDDDHIRELMTLTDKLNRMNEDSRTSWRIPVIPSERTINFRYGNDAELRADATLQFLDLDCTFIERQKALLSLMTFVTPEMRDGVQRILASGIKPVTEIEKRLKRLCVYLEVFYSYGMHSPMWQGDPWAHSYSSEQRLRIGNQGMMEGYP